MSFDKQSVPSREELKGVIARGAAEVLDPEPQDDWTEIRYEQGKIDSTFDAFESRTGEILDRYAGDDPASVPEDAQKALSTAISYASSYPVTTEEVPYDVEESGEEFRNLMAVASRLDGMTPASAGFMPEEQFSELFGERESGV